MGPLQEDRRRRGVGRGAPRQAGSPGSGPGGPPRADWESGPGSSRLPPGMRSRMVSSLEELADLETLLPGQGAREPVRLRAWRR